MARIADFLMGCQAAASIYSGKRILFQFDRAAFSFNFLPFKVPYPVPFKLLGDEAKGWLDTTYLSPSGSIRISRGNKVKLLGRYSRSFNIGFWKHWAKAADFLTNSWSGTATVITSTPTKFWIDLLIPLLQGTTFVLQKNVKPRQRLLQAITAKKDVEKVLIYTVWALPLLTSREVVREVAFLKRNAWQALGQDRCME